MRPHWPGRSYHILDNNCCAFCDTFCRTIGVGPIPLWTRNLADAGSVVNKASGACLGRGAHLRSSSGSNEYRNRSILSLLLRRAPTLSSSC